MSRQRLYSTIAQEQAWFKIFHGRVPVALPVGPFRFLNDAKQGECTSGMEKIMNHDTHILADIEFMEGKAINNTTIYYVNSGELLLPACILQPHRFVDTWSDWFGGRRVRFTDYPDFDKNYGVRSTFAQTKLVNFDDQIKAYLSYERGWTIEARHHQILLYKEDHRIKDELLRPFIQTCQTMVEMFKGNKVL